MLEIRTAKTLLLACGDIALAYLALYATLFFRYGNNEFAENWARHAGPFTLIFAVWAAIIFIVGLYDLEALRSRIELASRTIEALIAATLLSMAIFYFMPGIGIAPKTNLLAVVGSYAVLFAGWRLLTMHLFSRERFRLKVVFLGNDEHEDLRSMLDENPQLGYACLGVFDAEGSVELPDCDIIVVSGGLKGHHDMIGRLYRKFFERTAIIDYSAFYEKIRRAVPESVLDERWIVDQLAGRESTVYESFKRLFDIASVMILAMPTLALFPLIAAIIWIGDRGPILYRQTRVGQGGKLFRIVKFRTMRVDAEKHGAAFASKQDPRITRVGRFLRSTRLDELPQIWNILVGDMSFVGPRPERPEIEAELAKSIPLFPVRHLVRPGLTGWAQVSAPYAATLDDHLIKLRHDLYYLKYRSLTLDAAIILRTVYSVLKRKGR
jgi:exopolysaccharide biosynthesis polyprenyl glycosylphosphotransferase